MVARAIGRQTFSDAITFGALGAAACAIFMLQYWPVLRPRTKPLPPGSCGLPFLIGHSLVLFGDVGSFLRRMQAVFGAAFRCFFFGTHVVVVDMDTYDRVFAKLDSTARFAPLWPSGFKRLLGDNALQFFSGGSGPRGARHRRLKRKVMDALSPAELRLFLPRLEEIIRGEFEAMVEETEAHGHTQVMPHAYRIVKQVILEVILGPGGIREEEYLQDTSKILLEGMIAFPVDLGPLNAFGRAMRLRRDYCRDVDRQLAAALRGPQEVPRTSTPSTDCGSDDGQGGTSRAVGAQSSARSACRHPSPVSPSACSPATANSSPKTRTFLSRLAEDCEHGEGLSREEMQDMLISLLFGGSLTTAETMQWLTVELSRHSQWKDNVAKEQETMATEAARNPDGGGVAAAWDNCPPEGSRSPCPVSLAACHETLRLHCPIDILLRAVEEETDLGPDLGCVPRGWWVAVHLTERGMREGPTFDPARWQGRAAASQLSAFGLGPHVCVGRHLALWELQLFLHVWLTGYDLEVLSDKTFNSTGLKRFSGGLPVRVKRRPRPAASGGAEGGVGVRGRAVPSSP